MLVAKLSQTEFRSPICRIWPQFCFEMISMN